MLRTTPATLYAAFDRFPTRKGAATHIAHFAPTLFDHCGGGLLYVLGDDTMPLQQVEGSVEILRYAQADVNLLERAIGYGDYLARILDRHGDGLRIAHFRDPWSGLPILGRPHRYRTIYEVNALPSIELPDAYPRLSPGTLDKLRASERYCLEHSDHIVTPSLTTRSLLLDMGVPAERISHIPNGAEPHDGALPRPPEAPASYALYFGALQGWQGVDDLLRAFARLADLPEFQLVVCGSARSRDARRHQRFADKLGLGERVRWLWSLPAAELAPWIAHATVSVAPLKACARNVVQGCAPLKILESMAAGVAVIASDLPPVRELIDDGVDGRLVAAERPAELARALRLLVAYPDEAARLGAAARAKVRERYTWAQSTASLRAVYDRVERAPRGEPALASTG